MTTFNDSQTVEAIRSLLEEASDEEIRQLKEMVDRVADRRRTLANRRAALTPPPQKQVRDNFRGAVLRAACGDSGIVPDYRFEQWARWIDAVDRSKTTGYAFEGDFLNKGTVEIEVGRPRLLLACVRYGSRKHVTEFYAVVRMDPDGSLHEEPDLWTDQPAGNNTGWALRLRDGIAQRLAALSVPPNGAVAVSAATTAAISGVAPAP